MKINDYLDKIDKINKEYYGAPSYKESLFMKNKITSSWDDTEYKWTEDRDGKVYQTNDGFNWFHGHSHYDTAESAKEAALREKLQREAEKEREKEAQRKQIERARRLAQLEKERLEKERLRKEAEAEAERLRLEAEAKKEKEAQAIADVMDDSIPVQLQ